MILGISASGRKNRMIHQTVEVIATKAGLPFEVISLAGKKINGCIGCTQCASDNICKVKDDWNEIGEKMLKADIIVFGAPNYYGTINAIGHACLERTFSFRHQGAFTLKDKIGITVSTSRSVTVDPVREMIERFMKSNQMSVLGHVTVKGYDQCYTCGYGHDCEVGNVVRRHGILEKIGPEHMPADFSDQGDVQNQVAEIVELLKSKRSVREDDKGK
ncbi:flavodoxin family protein [Petrocella sp. FN5]|uniref:flavodoxin family protein n=1 Tax=Petrocella sp. FN5 TaxID=3032002 RepID=UPI0023DCC85F|nr:flavodoxin family protein [Petrocella sp. FN5]MDF1618420.1 flavodoxin family protein [Petrocella sp. FN5]